MRSIPWITASDVILSNALALPAKYTAPPRFSQPHSFLTPTTPGWPGRLVIPSGVSRAFVFARSAGTQDASFLRLCSYSAASFGRRPWPFHAFSSPWQLSVIPRGRLPPVEGSAFVVAASSFCAKRRDTQSKNLSSIYAKATSSPQPLAFNDFLSAPASSLQNVTTAKSRASHPLC